MKKECISREFMLQRSAEYYNNCYILYTFLFIKYSLEKRFIFVVKSHILKERLCYKDVQNVIIMALTLVAHIVI